jgi:hypothetical protein
LLCEMPIPAHVLPPKQDNIGAALTGMEQQRNG